MSEINTSLNLSKTCMVIRIIDIKLYVVMSQEKIWASVGILFKGHISYDNIKKINAIFEEMFMNHGALIYQKKQKNRMIYLNILKYQLKREKHLQRAT